MLNTWVQAAVKQVFNRCSTGVQQYIPPHVPTDRIRIARGRQKLFADFFRSESQMNTPKSTSTDEYLEISYTWYSVDLRCRGILYTAQIYRSTKNWHKTRILVDLCVYNTPKLRIPTGIRHICQSAVEYVVQSQVEDYWWLEDTGGGRLLVVGGYWWGKMHFLKLTESAQTHMPSIACCLHLFDNWNFQSWGTINRWMGINTKSRKVSTFQF